MLKTLMMTTAALIAAPVEGHASNAEGNPAADRFSLAGVTGEQVVRAVDRDFPAHDRDGNGALDRSEFAGWMVPLKAQSDPSAAADNPATRAWVTAAFDRADTDHNQMLSKAELLGLLSQVRQG
ncbi:hypothetical protein SAMN05192583_0355 [Sphingomonas gellani]|uniref:EF-hand domain-containing protein n=1 Tax=Sphingomonas gellani TaxID=1166340 RepID=A0A1H7YPD8_9SPHN|nr:hypothetical protein [Sphingomonas gellani]SEM48122.1 hypothetical protein SAMN05192583_0355 [Sphingomonas gellani]